MTFTLVYFETVRITRTVEAQSLQEAIAIGEEARDDWGDCDEQALGTDGVEEMYDSTPNLLYRDGEVQ